MRLHRCWEMINALIRAIATHMHHRILPFSWIKCMYNQLNPIGRRCDEFLDKLQLPRNRGLQWNQRFTQAIATVAADNYWPCILSKRNVSFAYELVTKNYYFRIDLAIFSCALTNNVAFVWIFCYKWVNKKFNLTRN